MGIRPFGLMWLLGASLLVAWSGSWAQIAPIRVGAEDDWAPFSSAKNGKPVGMAVELVQAIFAEAGMPLELVPLPYKRCLEETRLGRIAGCFDTLPDAQLRKAYLFHAYPLFSDPILILARNDSTESSLDLKGLESSRVIITHGYTYGDAFEANPWIQRVVASQDVNALRMLVAKRGDYALVYQRITNQLLRGEVQSLAGKIKPVGRLMNADLYIAFSRKYPGIDGILQRFDAAHSRLLKGPVIQQIEKRWN
jgi:polar amino acid transport system substrate-binding protein